MQVVAHRVRTRRVVGCTAASTGRRTAPRSFTGSKRPTTTATTRHTSVDSPPSSSRHSSKPLTRPDHPNRNESTKVWADPCAHRWTGRPGRRRLWRAFRTASLAPTGDCSCRAKGLRREPVAAGYSQAGSSSWSSRFVVQTADTYPRLPLKSMPYQRADENWVPSSLDVALLPSVKVRP